MKAATSLFLLILAALGGWTQTPHQPDVDWLSQMKTRIEFLASDSLQGRAPGTPQEALAAEFIAKEFHSYLKCKVASQQFVYQTFESKSFTIATNVYAYLNKKADSTILIGAHYDHLGLGGKRSLSLGKTGVHNGADDNASGVALMLSLAQNLQFWAGKRYNILFVAYSAHEDGLYGSQAFFHNMPRKIKPIASVLNFDMVGRMHPTYRWLKIYGAESDSTLQALFTINTDLNFKFEENERLKDLDTRSFFSANIPCLSFTTGTHDDYHKLSDDADKINYNGIWLIYMAISNYLRNLTDFK